MNGVDRRAMGAQGRLQGKIAIVTGAGAVGPGWGNGRATAVRFAQEGATVLALDLTHEALRETLQLGADASGEILPVLCDVTDGAEVERVVRECGARFGRLDVVVNNVGAPKPGGPVALSEPDWDRQIDLNLKSVFLMCKHAIPLMVAGGGGAIVNIASTSGIRFTGAPQVAYAAAKAGVIQLSRVAAVEYAPQRVRVNAIVPGQLHTPLVDAILSRDQAGGDLEQLLQRRRKRIPLPVEGDGRDTANAALFLASDEARFITGTELVVDGGMSARCD
ncbi:MAG: 3-oxoacyl-[acyl-carrier protein] reductase [Ramlibacter sp.]|jgi:NAD(P)-dependent dehydrogenase (short-subunit alcohol dehydrogenase family)|nr:3-oxoacyl-[acyl-carrier protein] reductase [Ramlibacter sp.]